MTSITQDQATKRMAELVDFLAVTPADSQEAANARTILSLWERSTGIRMVTKPEPAPPCFLEPRPVTSAVKPPTAGEIAEARKSTPAFGRFEALPPAVDGGHYGQMRPALPVHLPQPNAFERPGEAVRFTLEPPVGMVKPLAGAIAPMFERAVEPSPCFSEPKHATSGGQGQWTGTPADAKVGICIGTHASVAYVHLALETLRLNNPDVRVLIHDDSSDEQEALRSLAALYGADFVSTESRRMPTVGDMSAFAEALHWGSHEGLDIVVKCSRRFIIDRPFADGLRELMHNLRYATACAPCAHFSFGFRSELTAMAVEPWIRSGALVALDELVRQNQPHGLPEALYHEIARRVHKFAHPTSSGADDDHHPACDYVVRSEQRYGRRNEQGSDSWDSYAWWPLMGLSRVSRVPGVLWHDIDGPLEYAALAQYYHLPYDEAAFTVTPGE